MQTKNNKPNRYWYWESKNRYYSVRLQRNLFAEWTLLKSWGGIMSKHLTKQRKKDFYDVYNMTSVAKQ